MAEKSVKMKRNAADIREEMQKEGAVFLEFKTPPQAEKNWIKDWQAVEKYGFIISDFGCIKPYTYYRKTCKSGHKLKGHQRSIRFFRGRIPDKTLRTNQHGWPCDEQISHLCHDPDCCNPQHLVIEARWKNVRRNYCGEDGSCDCGMTPKCLRTYTNPETFVGRSKIESDISKIKELLANLHGEFPFQVRPHSWYNTENTKVKNRQKRNDRKRKHDAEKKKKNAKVQKKIEAKAEVSSDSEDDSEEPDAVSK